MPLDLAALVDPAHTAIVTSEVQNGVVGERAALPVLAEAAGPMRSALARLVAGGRAAGVQVVHCTAYRRADGKGANHNARLFLGVHGLDASGLTTPNLLESETDRALIASAAEVVVVADHGKWGVVGLSRISPLDAVDVLVTDDALPEDARGVLRGDVGRIILAHPEGAAS